MYPSMMVLVIQTFKDILKRDLGEANDLEPMFAATPLST